VRSFPTVLFAGLMGFPPRTAFEAEAGAEQAPDVNFD
jgi:LemA protein